MMNKPKIIEWTDITWNPVIGCETNCKSCYAKKIAKRFAKRIATINTSGYDPKGDYYERVEWLKEKLKRFEPTWLPKNFSKKFPKKPSMIFVNSMSDIWWWHNRWLSVVLVKIDNNRRHNFQFLTKFPKIYDIDDIKFPKNCWLGVTITKSEDISKEGFREFMDIKTKKKKFISFEPLLERINPEAINFKNIDWAIFGIETGNRKGKVIPKFDDFRILYQEISNHGIPVFLKDNLCNQYGIGAEREFPK